MSQTAREQRDMRHKGRSGRRDILTSFLQQPTTVEKLLVSVSSLLEISGVIDGAAGAATCQAKYLPCRASMGLRPRKYTYF